LTKNIEKIEKDHCHLENDAKKDKNSMENIIQRVRQFIVNNFLFGDGSVLTETTSFLQNGIIDSTGVLELVQYLEQTHNIAIADHELVPENLDTLNNIQRFLEKKLACAG
jgi:acyl carrier protein